MPKAKKRRVLVCAESRLNWLSFAQQIVEVECSSGERLLVVFEAIWVLKSKKREGKFSKTGKIF